ETDGYATPPGRAICAYRSARAFLDMEQQLDAGTIRFNWIEDDSPDLSYMSEQEIAHVEGVWGCVLEKLCPLCGAWQHLDSLWGIVDPNADYRRCVETSLFAEAHHA